MVQLKLSSGIPVTFFHSLCRSCPKMPSPAKDVHGFSNMTTREPSSLGGASFQAMRKSLEKVPDLSFFPPKKAAQSRAPRQHSSCEVPKVPCSFTQRTGESTGWDLVDSSLSASKGGFYPLVSASLVLWERIQFIQTLIRICN